ncbi:MAG TPA: Flp pilus assembly protein CpaB [Clostridiales bacterium]|nr:Flp pilus assembly protein CpaB [Clostridiales bacterium]
MPVRDRRLLVLTLLIVVVTGFAAYNYLLGLDRRVAVVVAAAALPEFTLLEPDALRVVHLPEGGVHPRAVSSPGELQGKVLMVPVEPGQQILVTQVRDPGTLGFDNQFVAVLGPGERAMMVPVPPGQAVGGGLAPRDLVDVIFVADEARLGFAFARVLLQGLRVLDVRGDQGGALTATRHDAAAGVVVAVTPKQAERLAFALEHGTLYLMTAGGREEPEVATQGTFLETLFDPEPAPERPVDGER